MSIKWMSKCWDMGLPPTEKLVALALADHCHDDGCEARPSRALIAKKCGISERQVVRALKSLVTKQIIEVERVSTPTTPNVYRFIWGGDICGNREVGGDVGVTRGGVTGVTRGGDVGVTLTISNNHQDNHHSFLSEGEASDAPVSKTFSESKFRDDAEELSDLLASLCVENGYRKTKVLKSWAVDMDKLMRIDGYTPDDVEMVLRWSQDDRFWRDNIRSPYKLREKFDTLLSQMSRSKKKAQSGAFDDSWFEED